jgi:site-specific recombinase XerD
VFFNYLVEYNKKFEGIAVKDFSLDNLAQVKATDINEYMEYLSYYVNAESGKELSNKERGKSRKLAAVRSMFIYFYKAEKIAANPAELVSTPKQREREIIRLEPNEVAEMLDNIESGSKLTKGQQRFFDSTGARDFALVTLLLGTGMRVSEAVGLDIKDIDFETNGASITRKGDKQMIVYFGDEVREALEQYLIIRREAKPLPGHENALFLSIQNKRIGVRSVQNLVKKYSQQVTTIKKISPHKLRSTYGTELYRETGDIYLVADVLGHSDVNTTRKHYAQQSDDNRRRAARVVKLRG